MHESLRRQHKSRYHEPDHAGRCPARNRVTESLGDRPGETCGDCLRRRVPPAWPYRRVRGLHADWSRRTTHRARWRKRSQLSNSNRAAAPGDDGPSRAVRRGAERFASHEPCAHSLSCRCLVVCCHEANATAKRAPMSNAPRVAFFPDSFHEVNGVAHTARNFQAYARRHALPFLCVRAALPGVRRATRAGQRGYGNDS